MAALSIVPAPDASNGKAGALVVVSAGDLERLIARAVEPIRQELRTALAAATATQMLAADAVASEMGVSVRTAQRWLRGSPLAVGRGRVRRIARSDLQALAGRAG
jgi:hypothetical protein